MCIYIYVCVCAISCYRIVDDGRVARHKQGEGGYMLYDAYNVYIATLGALCCHFKGYLLPIKGYILSL